MSSGGVALRKLNSQAVNADKITDALRKGKYAYYSGDSQPSVSAPNGYGDPTGTTGDINRALFPGTFQLRSQYHVKGTQTLLAPLLDVTDGLDVSQDQTDNDGVEHLFGALGAAGTFAYVVGTDNPFIRIKFKIADVSGTDDCNVGFRKSEAFQANVDDYADAFWINVNLGDILQESMVGGAATVTTDSGQNWADGEVHELEVKVIGRRGTAWLDGSPLAGVPEYNFTNALTIQPFFFFLQATTNPGKVWWREVEIGLLKSVHESGLSS